MSTTYVQPESPTNYTCTGDVERDEIVLIYEDAPDAYVGSAKSSGKDGDIIALVTRGKVRLLASQLAVGAAPVKCAPAYMVVATGLITHDANGGANARIGRFDRSEHDTSETWLILNTGSN